MGSTQAEVEVSYDVSNEFFRLWLDERMNYTCGIFDEPSETGTPITLEEAQVRKLALAPQVGAPFARKAPARHRLRLGRRPRVPGRQQRRQGVPRHHAVARAARRDHAPEDSGRDGERLLVPRLQAGPEVRRRHLHLHDGAHRPPGRRAQRQAHRAYTGTTSGSPTSGRTPARTSRSRPSFATASRGRARRSRTSASARTRSSRAASACGWRTSSWP